MTIEEVLDFFDNAKITKKLQQLVDVGLSYMTLGQSLTALSGGEIQRIKLAQALNKKGIYILDEPTTGLHPCDITKLMKLFNSLVDSGNTIIIIEHNLDVIKVADYIVDLGPEGGNRGGTIVAKGTPEDITKVKASYTGQYLKPLLEEGKRLNKRDA